MAQSLVTLVSAVGGEELLEAVPLDDVVKILRSVLGYSGWGAFIQGL